LWEKLPIDRGKKKKAIARVRVVKVGKKEEGLRYKTSKQVKRIKWYSTVRPKKGKKKGKREKNDGQSL